MSVDLYAQDMAEVRSLKFTLEKLIKETRFDSNVSMSAFNDLMRAYALVQTVERQLQKTLERVEMLS